VNHILPTYRTLVTVAKSWACFYAFVTCSAIAPDLFAGGNDKGARIEGRSDTRSVRVESIIVDVNGERRRIDLSEGLTVVRGDLVTFIDVLLMAQSPGATTGDTKHQPSLVVSGYKGAHSPPTADALGHVIDTARDFDSQSDLARSGDQYTIRVRDKGVTCGETVMRVEPPRLLSFDIAINGERKSVRAGDALSLRSKDAIRVVEIKTNIRGNENVQHDLLTVRGSDGRLKREIRFKRGATVFARVPIEWRGP
jgi:hypothetical protein